MILGATVKDIKKALEDMKKIYNYDEEKTVVMTEICIREVPFLLRIKSIDEDGSYIEIIKEVKVQKIE